MDFALNLLLIPWIGGYWFMHQTHFTRFRAKGLSNYRLLFEAAWWGLLFLVVAYVLAKIVGSIDCARGFLEWWEGFRPHAFIGTAFSALLLGMLAPPVVNCFWDEATSSTRAIIRYGDDLVRLLREAQQTRGAVMLTLENRKVYVGQVMVSASLDLEPTYITILPTLSGYRDEKKLGINWTTNYRRIYEAIDSSDPELPGLRIRDFLVVIPREDIQSATPFRHHVHARHFALRDIDTPPGTAASENA